MAERRSELRASAFHKTWSKEARKKALEARKRKAAGAKASQVVRPKLTSGHGPSWKATKDKRVIDAVGSRLSMFSKPGDTRFMTPDSVMTKKATWDRFARDARPITGKARKGPGEQGYCHDNMQELTDNDPSITWYFGYTKNRAGDDNWIIHSWGVDSGGTIVETAGRRAKYIGIPVSSKDFLV